MRPVCAHNTYHLGDCLITLHLLRSLAKQNPDRQFWFFASESYLGQLNEVVEDLSNLHLFSFESSQWVDRKHASIDTWKEANLHWTKSKVRWNWVEHTLEHHKWTAKRLGFQSPFSHATHLLFDYPALGPSVDRVEGRWHSEWLICNSDPGSGQLKPMAGENSGYLDDLIWRIGQNHSVMTTQPAKGALCTRAMGHSVSMIGRYSIGCENHIYVPNGPMWPCLNVHNHHLWNPKRKRIVVIDNGEDLTGLPWIQQVSRVEEAYDILRGENRI